MYVKYSAIMSLCLFISEFKIKTTRKRSTFIFHYLSFALVNLSSNFSYLKTKHEKCNAQIYKCEFTAIILISTS